MLNERHDRLAKPPNDFNAYTLGSIGRHNIVIACLPKGKIGTSSAAAIATRMISTFPAIRFGLMVGIGGGVPPKVRLGDVVVGIPFAQHPGVVQWDMGKAEQGGKFTRTGALNNPPSLLLTAIGQLESLQEFEGSKIPEILETIKERYPRLATKYLRSGHFKDNLFKASYNHVDEYENLEGSEENGWEHVDDEDEDEVDCCHCDVDQIVKRRTRDMKVHHGTIASGNQVIKDAAYRDKLSKDLGGILCVEMEAAGLPDNFPCIVIRGICDYADSHKNKAWQEHAAAVAAAYAKQVLDHVQPCEIAQERTVQEQINGIAAGIKQVHQHIFDEKDRKILDWITPLDYGTQHSDYLQRRHEGTGNWLLDSDEYLEWLNDDHGTLFCPGIPGSGKTILTSMVINDIEDRSKKDTSTAIAYVYLDYRREEDQTVNNLLSCIAKQLGGSQRTLPGALRDIYEKHNAKKTRPHMKEISLALHAVAASYRRVYLVIDALDECQTSNGCRAEFLSQIFDLQSQQMIKLFVTCRNIPEIAARFQNSTCLRISASMDDVRTYVEGNMRRMPSFVQRDSALGEEIVATISEAANGILSEMREHQKRSQTSGPDGKDEVITDAYDRIMKRIDGKRKQTQKTATRALSWITAAKRPLRTTELQHAFAVKKGLTKPDNKNIPDIEDLVSACCGLVTVDEESQVIRLAHYTIQEYFERRPKWFKKAQAEITRTCTRYLSFETFEDGHVQELDELQTRLRSNPLYDYAATYWGVHARHSQRCPSVQRFLKNQKAVQASFQVLWALKRDQLGLNSGDLEKFLPFPEDMAGLHLGAYFGLTDTVEGILNAYDIDSLDGPEHRTPLWWAAAQGNHDVVELLLLSKANPEARDIWRCTPLWQAASSGHRDVVKLFLEKGANIDDVADVLLGSETVTSRTSLSSLFIASDIRVEHAVEVVAKTAAHIEAQDCDGLTPLGRASKLGHIGVVRLLVRSGAEIDAVGDKGVTPLGTASEFGHKDVVEFLVQCGATTETRSKDDYTPLWIASQKGHTEVVEILLQAGADAEVKEEMQGFTPLMAAECAGETEVVEILRRHCTGARSELQYVESWY
ncbi:hypothetical protein PG996_015926 [Apiospora saccharicola]|uniref:Nucleoside phosphorylase domain-containing protein n=1 Tax=Apiospora saccharicola TaxID=335842 RepID=A0ABR1TMS4_9PEZI